MLSSDFWPKHNCTYLTPPFKTNLSLQNIIYSLTFRVLNTQSFHPIFLINTTYSLRWKSIKRRNTRDTFLIRTQLPPLYSNSSPEFIPLLKISDLHLPVLLLLTSSQTCPIIKLAALFDLRCPSHSIHILYIPLIAPKTRLTPNTHIHQLSHMRANVVVRAATRDLPKVYLSYNGCLSFCRSAKKKKVCPG